MTVFCEQPDCEYNEDGLCYAERINIDGMCLTFRGKVDDESEDNENG